MNEYETHNKGSGALYDLRGLYVVTLIILMIITLLSVGIYVLFSIHVYIPYLFGGLFIGLVFIPPFLIYLAVFVETIVTDVKRYFKRRRALSIPEEVVREKSNYKGSIVGMIVLGVVAFLSAYLMFNSVFDLFYVVFPKDIILYDVQISTRKNVGRKAILRKGQIITGTDENGQEYELFLGKGYDTIEYISEIEVKYLPNTKIVRNFNVKK